MTNFSDNLPACYSYSVLFTSRFTEGFVLPRSKPWESRKSWKTRKSRKKQLNKVTALSITKNKEICKQRSV